MSSSIKFKSDLDTPSLTLNLDMLEANIKIMQASISKAGKNLRPHAKTHKCTTIAKMQIKAGAVGVCAAKVSEAEVLVKAGISGVLITGPIVSSQKISKFAGILAIDPSVMIVIDSKTGADMLSEILQQQGLSANVLIDFDVCQKRSGIKPSDAVDFANHILTKKNLTIRGIQAYAGNLQHIQSFEERKKTSLESMQSAAEAFRNLSSRIDSCKIFSASGTGTSEIDIAIPEQTELQCGSYTCMDVEYGSIGSSENPDGFVKYKTALRLLTTVCSANQKDFVTVDAGLKALYSDAGFPKILTPEYQALRYDWSGDEYGKVIREENSGMKLPCLGEVVELAVSHCDPTINLFDRFYVIRGNEVVDIWPIDLRGCCM